jgi:hypothetical protein
MGFAAIAGAVVGAGSLINDLINGNSEAETAIEAAKAGTHQKVQSEEIKHMPPALEGSASAESDMLAIQFHDYASMSQGQGYLGVPGAKERAEAEAPAAAKKTNPAAAEMIEKSKKATLLKIKHLGIDDGSGNNPNGVSISFDDFKLLHKIKSESVGKPIELDSTDDDMIVRALKSMGKEGTPKEVETYRLLIDMYYDPQLSGETLDAMAGVQRNLTPAEIQEKRKAIASMRPLPGENASGFAGRQNQAYRELEQLLVGGGTNSEKMEAINELKNMGVLDSQNHQSRGQLRKHLNIFLKKAQESSMIGDQNAQEDDGLLDQYNSLSSKEIDPKRVKSTYLGDGLVRTVILNNDDTVAVSFLDGEVKFPDGSSAQEITIIGSSLSDWRKFAGLAEEAKPKKSAKPKASESAEEEDSESPAPKPEKKPAAKSAKPRPSSKPEGYEGVDLEEEEEVPNSKMSLKPGSRIPKGRGVSGMPGMPPKDLPEEEPSGIGGPPEDEAAAAEDQPIGPYTQMLLDMLNDPEGAKMLEQLLSESIGELPPGYEGAPLAPGA